MDEQQTQDEERWYVVKPRPTPPIAFSEWQGRVSRYSMPIPDRPPCAICGADHTVCVQKEKKDG